MLYSAMSKRTKVLLMAVRRALLLIADAIKVACDDKAAVDSTE